jgi:hypothetical protein
MLWEILKLDILKIRYKCKILLLTFWSLLPEIIVEYFELTSYKRRWNPPPYLKEVNWFPKEDKLSSKGFFWWDNSSGLSIRGHQVYLHITRRRWLNEDTRLFLEIEFSSRRNSGNTGVRVFLKEINRFQAYWLQCYCLFLCKNLQHISTKILWF